MEDRGVVLGHLRHSLGRANSLFYQFLRKTMLQPKQPSLEALAYLSQQNSSFFFFSYTLPFLCLCLMFDCFLYPLFLLLAFLFPCYTEKNQCEQHWVLQERFNRIMIMSIYCGELSGCCKCNYKALFITWMVGQFRTAVFFFTLNIGSLCNCRGLYIPTIQLKLQANCSQNLNVPFCS